MKAVLVNDTRSEKHIGCDLVVANTLREAHAAGIEIVATILNSELSETEARIQSLASCELVLINGEGTMHDDRRRPLLIAAAAKRAKAMGKKVVLFNTVWQNNIRLNEYLKYFDRIFCRETFSTNCVLNAGFAARTVPDMIFASQFATAPKAGGGIVVIGSVNRKISNQLALLAAWRKFSFLPMCESRFLSVQSNWWLRTLLKWRTGAPLPYPDVGFIDRLQKSAAVISGRFHGTALCLLLSKPVASIASNTHKIEGLYSDIGLDSSFLVPGHRGWWRQDFFTAQFTEVRSKMGAVRNYVESASAKISSMFQEISSL